MLPLYEDRSHKASGFAFLESIDRTERGSPSKDDPTFETSLFTEPVGRIPKWPVLSGPLQLEDFLAGGVTEGARMRPKRNTKAAPTAFRKSWVVALFFFWKTLTKHPALVYSPFASLIRTRPSVFSDQIRSVRDMGVAMRVDVVRMSSSVEFPAKGAGRVLAGDDASMLSRWGNAVSRFYAVIPQLRYRTSWSAGVCVAIIAVCLNLDSRCVVTGAPEVLIERASRLSEPLGVVVARYHYGWPWRVLTLETSIVADNKVPRAFHAQSLEIREVAWTRLMFSIAVATVAVIAVSALIDQLRVKRTSVRRVARYFTRFRLRTMLLVVAVLALWINLTVLRRVRQHELVMNLKSSGAEVLFDHEEAAQWASFSENPPDSYWNRLARQVVGDYGVGEVYGVLFIWRSTSSEELVQLQSLGQVEVISLGTTDIDSTIVDALSTQTELWVISKKNLKHDEKVMLKASFPNAVVLNDPALNHGGYPK